MKWNQPIVLGIDGLGMNHIQNTNSVRLKQKWHSETDLRGFYDVTDPEDFVKSLEVWSSIIRGKNLARFAEDFQYEYIIKGIRVSIPRFIGKRVEKRAYEESPLLDPIYRLNFLRDSGFFVEALWAFRWDKIDTCFAYADECNIESLIAYNPDYSYGCRSRRLMGDYLWIGSKYRAQREFVVNKIKQDIRRDGGGLNIADVYATIDKTPTKLMRRGKLKYLKNRREILRRKFEDHVGAEYEKTKNTFLEKLRVAETGEKKSRIDFGYFSNIDSLLHLFREKALIESLYSEAVKLYNTTAKIADEQDRPLLIMSDHGMEFYKGSMTHSKKGFFSANYTFDELQENLDLHPNVEDRFFYGMPRPQDLGLLMKAHLTYY